MKRVPKSFDVDRAMTSLLRSLKGASKGLSAEAAKVLVHGKYDGASAMVEKCRAIGEFQRKVFALREEWHALRELSRGTVAAKSEVTPVWKYYHPIVVALNRLEGAAKQPAIEQEIEALLVGRLTEGDLAVTGKGEPRWKISVRRARRPMVKEGFLELQRGAWRLTEAGRELAQKPMVSEQRPS